jgi:cytochrome P450
MASSVDATGLVADIPTHIPPDRVRDVDFYALDDLDAGYHEAWLQLRQPDTPSLIWTPRCGGHWIATQRLLVREIFADYSRFSCDVFIIPKDVGKDAGFVPSGMAPPELGQYRAALDRAVGLSQVRPREDKIRAICGDLIDQFVAKGRCDFGRDYAQKLPMRIYMEFAKLPEEDIPTLMSLAGKLTRPQGNTPEEVAADMATGNDGLKRYAEGLVLQRRGKGGDDFVSRVVDTEVNGGPMPHAEAVSLVSALMLGGLDTVVNFLSFVMLHLACHPEVVEELNSDPLLLMRGVEELFRRFPVSASARMVAYDMDYEGVSLKQGEMILIPNLFDGLDESTNSCPLNLDFSRKSFSHSMFGQGPHRCPGLHLARMETILTLQEWLKRIPRFRLAEDARPVFRSGMLACVENVELAWDVPSPV